VGCLSVIENNRPPIKIAPSIFVISKPVSFENGSMLIFEVLETGAESLKSRVGMTLHYVFERQAVWGRLESLEACDSSHPGLALMRDRATLRGVITFFGLEAAAIH
jgi:hypothetical protein